MVLHRAHKLMAERAHEKVVEQVIVVVMFDCLPILELDLLVPVLTHVALSHARVYCEGEPARELVVFIWAYNQIMRRRRMMLRLLEVDHGTILADCLVCFSENGVQWLLKDACIVIPVQ